MATPGMKSHIEAAISVMPTKSTDPRSSCTVQIPNNLINSNTILQRRFHVVLCFNKASEDDSGWMLAGWIKESLGMALVEQPILAGRMRRLSEGDGGNMEIVSNDSGVRMVECRVDMKLNDFVELKAKKEAEAELVFWEDVAEQNPQFSPLFYVQITSFACGGYSIGISCNLLLTDPFNLKNFLKRWAHIHKTLVSKTNLPKVPIFYHPNCGTSYSLLEGSNTDKNIAESVVVTIPFSDNNIHDDLVVACIDEAERAIGRKMASKFSLLHKLSSKDAKVEICSTQRFLENSSSKDDGLTCGRIWDEPGLDNICFNEGNKPAYVSCWINSFVNEGSVMIIPSNEESSTKVVVTFT